MTDGPEFEVRLEGRPGDGPVIVHVVGQADLHTAPELRSLLGRTIDQGARTLVVDLSETTFIDSMTLGVLLGALKRVKPLSGALVIRAPHGNIRRVFEITSLDRVFEIADSREDAVSQATAGSRSSGG